MSSRLTFCEHKDGQATPYIPLLACAVREHGIASAARALFSGLSEQFLVDLDGDAALHRFFVGQQGALLFLEQEVL